jgi:hypothetical protein
MIASKLGVQDLENTHHKGIIFQISEISNTIIECILSIGENVVSI